MYKTRDEVAEHHVLPLLSPRRTHRVRSVPSIDEDGQRRSTFLSRRQAQGSPWLSTTSPRTISCVTLQASQTSSRASTASPSRTRQILAFPNSTLTPTMWPPSTFRHRRHLSANENAPLPAIPRPARTGALFGKAPSGGRRVRRLWLPCKTMPAKPVGCYADPWTIRTLIILFSSFTTNGDSQTEHSRLRGKGRPQVFDIKTSVQLSPLTSRGEAEEEEDHPDESPASKKTKNKHGKQEYACETKDGKFTGRTIPVSDYKGNNVFKRVEDENGNKIGERDATDHLGLSAKVWKCLRLHASW